MAGGRHRGFRAGFTLIEILAVVAILALAMLLVLPNLGTLRGRALVAEAEQIAAQLELARLRAVMTGVPHRVWLDLDEAEYRLEWLVGADPAVSAGGFDLEGNTPLSLEAPRGAQTRYEPVPGNFGRLQVVEFPFYFESIATPDGRIDAGEAQVAFDRDGSAEYTEIYLEDSAGHEIALDVHPLDERVRIRREL